jgi:hypothetical protein
MEGILISTHDAPLKYLFQFSAMFCGYILCSEFQFLLSSSMESLGFYLKKLFESHKK